MASVRKSLESAVDQVSPDGVPDRLQTYLDCISTYEREFKDWESRVEKILKRYRDEKRDSRSSGQTKFNILWSNIQTLVPACFSRLPQPDVTRRFRDNDPVGRVAALILERALEYEVQHYKDYRRAMKMAVRSRFLGGRGQAWARYEPKFKEAEQVTEDAEEPVLEEQLDYECAPTDYVNWKDFGHEVARTWEEVTKVWRIVYMSESAVKDRFGEDVAKRLPYDASPELKHKDRDLVNVKKQAKIYEIWDKEEGKVVWISKSFKELLDERDDPLGLEDFFPCPEPLYATLTEDSLVPVPDFTLYQDQANSLDLLADRIDGLCKMLQVKGVYDGSADSSLARIFTEGVNGTLLPVKNWAAFAEKNGLSGQIDVIDLKPIADALKSAVEAFVQKKNEMDELSGVIDVIRGQVDPKEKLGQTQMKGQYASLRLRDKQQDVAEFATGLLQLKAQIICTKFNPKTIMAMAAVDQLSPEDQQVIPQAMTLLVGEQRLQNPEAEAPNPMRSFRIGVAADTLVEIDEQSEKQERMEMLTAFAGALEKGAQVGAMAPPMIPLVLEVLKFGIQSFKVGKTIEGTFDTALDQLKQMAAQPQGMPPEVQKQLEEQQAQLQQGAQELQKKDMELQKKEKDLFQKETQLQVKEVQFDANKQVFAQEQKMMGEHQKMAEERMGMKAKEETFNVQREKDSMMMAKKDAEREGKEVEAKKTDSAEIEARNERMEKAVQAVIESNQLVVNAVTQLAKVLAAPKKIKRGVDGRAESVETVA